MSQERGPELAQVRAEILAAHAQVQHGRYAEAFAVFAKALPALEALLGADHPEVAELVDDLETVQQMAGVANFGAVMGYRWNDPVPGGD